MPTKQQWLRIFMVLALSTVLGAAAVTYAWIRAIELFLQPYIEESVDTEN